MEEHDRSTQNLARAAGSTVRIARAASVAGLKGAAVQATLEVLPFLVKVVLCVIAALLLLPLVVFTAIPNLFFGYESSEAEPIMTMNEQAKTLGSAYLSLEEFEATQIDALVTTLAEEYAESGAEIDRIEVENDFDEGSLLWFIAINSVLHRQDLNTMSAETVRSFSVSQLALSPSLDVLTGGDAVTTTLKIRVRKPDPDTLMAQLGFDDEAKLWASVFHQTLADSDALNAYADHFEAYRPSYGGDESYTGGIEHGSGGSNDFDLSAFTNPATKNNRDLAAYAVQAWEHGWGYVWGSYGNVLTPSMLEYKCQQYPDGVGNYREFIAANWVGRRTADCIGLIKGYGWLDASTGKLVYGANGMPDYGANQMYQSAKSGGAACGSLSSMPEIPGLVLWMPGHTGVYIGGGYAIEAMGTKYGVVRTAVAGRGWQAWYKLPCITYLD